MYEVKAAGSAFYAQSVVVGGPVSRFDIDDGLAFYYQIKLTSCSTMRTCGQHLSDLPVSIGSLSLECQRTRWTYARTVTAGLAPSLLIISSKGCIHYMERT